MLCLIYNEVSATQAVRQNGDAHTVYSPANSVPENGLRSVADNALDNAGASMMMPTLQTTVKRGASRHGQLTSAFVRLALHWLI